MIYVFNLWVTVEQSAAPTNSSPAIPPLATSPPHRARHLLSGEYHLAAYVLYVHKREDRENGRTYAQTRDSSVGAIKDNNNNNI
jgi:hypothetical protein